MGRPGICTSQRAREGGPGRRGELPSGHLSRKALQKEQNLNQGKSTGGAEAFGGVEVGKGLRNPAPDGRHPTPPQPCGTAHLVCPLPSPAVPALNNLSWFPTLWHWRPPRGAPPGHPRTLPAAHVVCASLSLARPPHPHPTSGGGAGILNPDPRGERPRQNSSPRFSTRPVFVYKSRSLSGSQAPHAQLC